LQNDQGKGEKLAVESNLKTLDGDKGRKLPNNTGLRGRRVKAQNVKFIGCEKSKHRRKGVKLDSRLRLLSDARAKGGRRNPNCQKA